MESDPHVLRELDHVRSALQSLESRTTMAIDTMGRTTTTAIESLASTIKSHNGRLTLVERAHERIQGARELVGNWRPLIIAMIGGTVVSIVSRLL